MTLQFPVTFGPKSSISLKKRFHDAQPFFAELFSSRSCGGTAAALAVLAASAIAQAQAAPTTLPAQQQPAGTLYPYDQPGDKKNVSNTNVLERWSPINNANNQSYKVTSPRARAKATFTTAPIVVDGVREAAWDAATPYPITNKFNAGMTAPAPDATAQGTMRLLWNGPTLYILVEVTGDATQSDAGTPNWNSGSYAPNTDGLFVFMDVFNDQWGLETETQGDFFLGANPALTAVTSYTNNGIPSLGSFFNPNNQDYCTRLKAFKSSGYKAGNRGGGVNYTYEIALQIEGWGDRWDRELKNGTQIGLEAAIFDQGNSFTDWSKTEYFAGREGTSNLPNSERVRNRDWGVVTLDGWDGKTPFAYSGWRAEEDIRFWKSKSNPGGSGIGTAPDNSGDGSLVWTAKSKARMIAAKDAYNALKDKPDATRRKRMPRCWRFVRRLPGCDGPTPSTRTPTTCRHSTPCPMPGNFSTRARGPKAWSLAKRSGRSASRKFSTSPSSMNTATSQSWAWITRSPLPPTPTTARAMPVSARW